MERNLPLSVTICTLNEEINIAACLDAVTKQKPFEVIVVDGGSDDKTREIAQSLGAFVINAGRKGLAHQRKVGVDKATQRYTALIDADHRPEPGCFSTLIAELQEKEYDGIEAQILSVSNKGYWDWGMEQNFKLTHNIPGPRIMIGTPCIYSSKVLKKVNFDPFMTGPSDDTDLCYRMTKEGYKLGVGTPTVLQEHRSDFKTFRRKWMWYGKGDAQFSWKHPERVLSIINHVVYNYPIKKSFIALKKGQPKVVPFFLCCGLFRFSGFVREGLRLILSPGPDKNIYKT